MNIIVIGGGAAGLMAAGTAAEQGAQVTLLETNEKVGRKLFITGKGRCNVCNNCDVQEVLRNVPVNPRFLYSALGGFGPADVMDFFENHGVALKTERGNRVFPVSDRSHDVANALERAYAHAGGKVVHAAATDILTQDGAVSAVVTTEGAIDCDAAVICTGGLSYPLTGSTGDGYRFAQRLGHTVTPTRASLVPLESEDPWCAEMQGFSLRNVTLTVYDEQNKAVYSDLGEMLFTHFGVSGPLVLSASAHMRDFSRHKYRLSIDLKPALDEKKLDARILRDFLTYISTIQGKSAKTAHEYYLDLRLFLRVLKHNKGLVPRGLPIDRIAIDDVDIDFLKTVTLSDAYDYLEYMSGERPTQQNSPDTEFGLSVNSRARKVSAIRAFFRYLTDKKHMLETNPMASLESPTIRKTLPVYLTADDSVKLLEAVQGEYAERDYCILTLFLNCGLRISELVGLNLQDDHGDSLRILGKGSKERVVYLNNACREALDRYLAVRSEIAPPRTTAMFLSNRRTRISCDSVQVMVKKNLTRAGLDASQYSTHKLRHTAATLMLQNGVDVRTLQEVLGHEHLNTTQIYTHVDNDQLRTAAAANPLGEFSPDEKTAKKISDS